jgi:hypothetical protein
MHVDLNAKPWSTCGRHVVDVCRREETPQQKTPVIQTSASKKRTVQKLWAYRFNIITIVNNKMHRIWVGRRSRRSTSSTWKRAVDEGGRRAVDVRSTCVRRQARSIQGRKHSLVAPATVLSHQNQHPSIGLTTTIRTRTWRRISRSRVLRYLLPSNQSYSKHMQAIAVGQRS